MAESDDLQRMRSAPVIRFAGFALDPADRRLTRDGAPVQLNARYFDALALLASEPDQLVTKDRFMAEVWRGVPVTDEALTQCIRTLRRVLGDDAGAPRFIATVPKHGYRFVAAIGDEGDLPPAVAQRGAWPRVWALAAGGTTGGAAAGAAVGLCYGLSAATRPVEPGPGAASVLLVLIAVGIAAGLIAGAGVASGIAATEFFRARRWYHAILGGAGGGLVMGTVAKLVGIDAFALLLGRAPGDIAGALEGGLSGAAAGVALWLGGTRLRRSALWAAGAGGAAGLLIALLGGRAMGGSLDLLTRRFAASPLRLDRIGGWFGEAGFGPVAQTVTAVLETGVFVTGVVAALVLARRTLD